MKNRNHPALAPIVAVAATVLSLPAATVVSVGVDTTTGPDWRTASTVKTSFDPINDDIYGSDGYFVGYSAIGAANTTTALTLQSLPSYVSTVTTSGAFFASDGYANIDDPTGSGEINGGLYYSSGTKFSFTVVQDVEFLLGVIVGEGLSGSPSSITINQTAGLGGGTATNSGFTTAPGAAEYVFFNINAAAGDEFNVDIVASNQQGITGLAFEAIPEPSTSAAFLVALAGLSLRRRRG
jgi:hypothetical protein